MQRACREADCKPIEHFDGVNVFRFNHLLIYLKGESQDEGLTDESGYFYNRWSEYVYAGKWHPIIVLTRRNT
jgi:hypothetical protein